jgi:hypothetical protein
MKKLFLLFTGIVIAAIINAQTLEEIVNKYSVANKLDNLSKLTSVKITAKMSMMGMEMPLIMQMKNPNKIRTVTSMGGQEIITVFDGVKGYTISPMTGSTAPVEMSPAQVKQTINNNILQNYIKNYFKNGKLTLAGDDKVNEKPAFKLKAMLDESNSSILYIDKTTYQLIKTSTSGSQGGVPITIDSYMTDYKDNNGVILPMKTTSSASGMEFVISFEKVEVNIPMDDSIFKVK